MQAANDAGREGAAPQPTSNEGGTLSPVATATTSADAETEDAASSSPPLHGDASANSDDTSDGGADEVSAPPQSVPEETLPSEDSGSSHTGLTDRSLDGGTFATAEAGAEGGTPTPTCGNGVLEPELGERCDDGNTSSGDGCSSDCGQIEILRVWGGLSRACAQVGTLGVKCWGSNGYGALGNGDTEPRGTDSALLGDQLEFTVEGMVSHVSIGPSTTCAIKDGSLLCWGSNTAGQLGVGDERVQALTPMGVQLPREVVSVSNGHVHTCVVLDNGEVRCWGAGGLGSLGLGSSDDHDTPPEASIQLGGPAKSVACFGYGACALMQAGTVRCWGENNWGEGGAAFTKFGDEPEEVHPPLLDLGDGFSAETLQMGVSSGCALSDSGLTKCWGNDIGDDIGEVGNALPVLDWGGEVSALWARDGSPCVSLTGGELECRDSNGLNSYARVDLGSGLRALEVGGGGDFTCALLSDYTVVCWGANQWGQLGIGAPANEVWGDDPGEMGDGLQRVLLLGP